jgi:hypothetical protein
MREKEISELRNEKNQLTNQILNQEKHISDLRARNADQEKNHQE